MVNEDLGIYQYPHPKAKRDLILIHKANVMTELAGCIAPGSRHGGLGDKFAVYSSEDTMDALKVVLGDKTHTLTIHWRTI